MYGMATREKTIVVLSDDLIQELWPQVAHIISTRTSSETLDDDVIVIVCGPVCAIPPELRHVAKVYYPDDHDHCWQQLSRVLATDRMCISLLVVFALRCFSLSFSDNCHYAPAPWGG